MKFGRLMLLLPEARHNCSAKTVYLSTAIFRCCSLLPRCRSVLWQLEIFPHACFSMSLIVAAAGGSFLLESRTPAEVFTPEDLNEEQRRCVELERYPL